MEFVASDPSRNGPSRRGRLEDLAVYLLEDRQRGTGGRGVQMKEYWSEAWLRVPSGMVSAAHRNNPLVVAPVRDDDRRIEGLHCSGQQFDGDGWPVEALRGEEKIGSRLLRAP